MRFPTIQIWLSFPINPQNIDNDRSHIEQPSPSISPFHTHLRTCSAVSSVILCSYFQLCSREVNQKHLTPGWSAESLLGLTKTISTTNVETQALQKNYWTPKRNPPPLTVFSFWDILQGVCIVLSMYLWSFYGHWKKMGNFKSFYSHLRDSGISSWEMPSCSKFYSFFLLYVNQNILIHSHDSTALFPGYSLSYVMSSIMNKAQPASALATKPPKSLWLWDQP